MRVVAHRTLYSATDLLNFLGCRHATALDLGVLAGVVPQPADEKDAYLDLLGQKGLQHEGEYLETLRGQGKSIREIPKLDALDEKAELTRAAMREGVDVIYQGALVSVPWHGYSDFLLKTPAPSRLGAWSYEVADTKLARTAKPKHVVQLCLYSQMVALEQELLPERAHVVLGDGSTFTFRLNDYLHYCDAARERFEKFVGNQAAVVEAAREDVPEPCSHCDMCRWASRCDEQWDAIDHLSRVARLSTVQSRKLSAAGVTTLEALARLPEGDSVAKIQPETLTRIRSQARLQYEKRATGENKVEVLPLEERRGFARLPKPHAGDLFFDMEGDPVYSADGSLEYLFGFHYEDDGKATYKAFWARNRDEEKKAFEDALDFITDRLRRFPEAFVYHYASYEQTALRKLARQYGTSKRKQGDEIKRLAQAYGTRENEVDDLLRDRKLVDLYKVVREGIRVSEPSYSLKNLETFYAPKRTDAISSGGDSVVAFERWLAVGDDTLLKQIEDYNAFDCLSTKLCRDWLLGLRPNDVKWFDPAEEKSEEEAQKERERREGDKHILDLREALVAGVADDERAWRELLGFLLEYHRREARREWWDFFKRLDARVDELIDDAECIGGVTPDRSTPPRPEKRSMLYAATFPEQDYKLDPEKSVVRTDTKKSVDLFSLDDARNRLELKLGSKQPPLPDVFSLIPSGPRNDLIVRDAIERYAQALIAGTAEPYAAITSILRKDRVVIPSPSVVIPSPSVVIPSETRDLHLAAVRQMHGTHLVIQGPPGTGKTFTSAHAIVALLKEGKRIAVASHTHKAINNLLCCIEEVAKEQNVTFRGAKKYSEDGQKLNGRVIVDVKKNEEITRDHQLVAGTVWLFSRPEMDLGFDYIFVDEAGQVSLANVVAMGTSAKNIVLVGDQMQLAQPVKGAHPGGSGVSALDYLMKGYATVPPDRGILLSKTWRMHPDLCRFVSQAFYDGRLESDPSTARRRLVLAGDGDRDLLATGLGFIAVDHADNSQRSVEEADRIEALYARLLGMEWVGRDGEQRRLTMDDILVVSPYNMQVNLLADRLPVGARVGTVDKFQGQEGAIVLMSLAASDGTHAPRGIDFLYSPNRLNVGVSRGRCTAIVVGSPELAASACRTVEQLKLVNTMCWIMAWSAAKPRSVIPSAVLRAKEGVLPS